MSAVCWLYGRMIHQALNGRPIGLVATAWNGTAIEVWLPPQVFQQCNSTTTQYVLPVSSQRNDDVTWPPPYIHSCLFNSMIYPFTRMVIYGALWYQGESNVGNPTYACKFAGMINAWRQLWNQRTNGNTELQFPFGFVQVIFIFNSTNVTNRFD